MTKRKLGWVLSLAVVGALALASQLTAASTQATGLLRVCKEAGGAGVTGDFRFRIAGTTYTVPVGSCSAPIALPAGQVTVTERERTGYNVTGIRAEPEGRLVASNLATRTATVDVVAGDESQTTVVFTNVLELGDLRLCKAAGTGVTPGTSYTFHVEDAGNHTIPAGECAVVGSFPVRKNVTITETIPPGGEIAAIAVSPTERLVGLPDLATGVVEVEIGSGVTEVTYTNNQALPPRGELEVCKVAGPGIVQGRNFRFDVNGHELVVPAGSCVVDGMYDVGTEVTVDEDLPADGEVTEIAVDPADRVSAGPNLGRGKVTVTIGPGTTRVAMTNVKLSLLRICKVAGVGVATGTSFTFTVDGTNTVTVPAGTCADAGRYRVDSEVDVEEELPADLEVEAIAASPTPQLTASDLGAGTATVKIDAGTTSVTFTNRVQNRPPDCSGVRATPNVLWPPNGKFTLVRLAGVTDPDGDATTPAIEGVTQDEEVGTEPDARRVAAPDAVDVRAERKGGGNGRVYRIAFTATDPHGAQCSGVVTVGVPHDQRGAAAIDSGGQFDSLG